MLVFVIIIYYGMPRKARKTTKRTTRAKPRKAPARKRTTKRRTTTGGSLSIASLAGVTNTLWSSMNPNERLVLLKKNRDGRVNAMQRGLAKASLAGQNKTVDAMKARIASLLAPSFEQAAAAFSVSGKL